jgi:hypothetical protein
MHAVRSGCSEPPRRRIRPIPLVQLMWRCVGQELSISMKPAAQQAAEADGRGLQLRGRPCSTRIVVTSRAAAA